MPPTAEQVDSFCCGSCSSADTPIAMGTPTDRSVLLLDGATHVACLADPATWAGDEGPIMSGRPMILCGGRPVSGEGDWAAGAKAGTVGAVGPPTSDPGVLITSGISDLATGSAISTAGQAGEVPAASAAQIKAAAAQMTKQAEQGFHATQQTAEQTAAAARKAERGIAEALDGSSDGLKESMRRTTQAAAANEDAFRAGANLESAANDLTQAAAAEQRAAASAAQIERAATSLSGVANKASALLGAVEALDAVQDMKADPDHLHEHEAEFVSAVVGTVAVSAALIAAAPTITAIVCIAAGATAAVYVVGEGLTALGKEADRREAARRAKPPKQDTPVLPTGPTILRGGACFIPATLVATPGGMRPIEQLRVGELVYCRAPDGRLLARHIVHTFEAGARELIRLRFEDDTIECTPRHRFYVIGRGWVRAADLAPAYRIVTQRGRLVELLDRQDTDRKSTVHNLTVEQYHNYFVGGSAMLVHNMMRGGSKRP